MLFRALRAFDGKHSPAHAAARFDPIVVLGQRVISALCFLERQFSILDALLCIRAFLLPVLPLSLDTRSELVDILMHLVERICELYAVVCHSIVGTAYGGELGGIGVLATILSSDACKGCAAEFLEALGMLVFEAGALAEEAGKVLGSVRSRN